MILRQPIRQRRRQQQHLATVARDEVLTHPEIVINRPDDSAKPDSLTKQRSYGWASPALATLPLSIWRREEQDRAGQTRSGDEPEAGSTASVPPIDGLVNRAEPLEGFDLEELDVVGFGPYALIRGASVER